MFVVEYGFTVTEYDAERPWIVLAREHRTVTLEETTSFFDWATAQWPSPRWSVELDPWQRAPSWPP